MPAHIMFAIDPKTFTLCNATIASSDQMTSMDGEVWMQFGQAFPGEYNEALRAAVGYVKANPCVSHIFLVLQPFLLRNPETRNQPLRSTRPHLGPPLPEDVCFHDDWQTYQPYADSEPTYCVNCRQQLYRDDAGEPGSYCRSPREDA